MQNGPVAPPAPPLGAQQIPIKRKTKNSTALSVDISHSQQFKALNNLTMMAASTTQLLPEKGSRATCQNTLPSAQTEGDQAVLASGKTQQSSRKLNSTQHLPAGWVLAVGHP